jgi:hypothetical protein
MTAEIIAALKAIPAIVSLLKDIGSEIAKMRDALTEKNIESLKREVRADISALKDVKSKEDRAKMIEALNRKLSK